MELRHAAGNLLVVGLAGKELSAMERAWLKLIRPAGIILYKRNIADAPQTRAMLKESLAYCTPHAVSFVDVEGGTVNRLNEALAVIPSAQAVARAMLHPTLSQKARKDGAPNVRSVLAREHGELIARAVAAFGFNTSLAPMIDLALPDSAEVLGTRCPAREPAGVIAYAREFLIGLKSRGIVGCGKHFPGLGGGTRDSHLETPAIQRDGADIWRDDLEPYRALSDEMPIVMINHAAYPMTPGRQRPASVSSYWIQSILRKRIGYRGIVLSDDLEMGGILKFMPIEDAAIEAIRTGSDLIEICHHAEPILQAYEALVSEGERSAAFRKLLLEQARITERKRARVFPRAMPPALNKRQFEALQTRILRFGETIAAAQPAEVHTA
ncbi:MAG TPA: beta-N-acetylhexosaminidase [Terracidiphilus sp.]|nr:beta-N-acetylhexosaminidase [Terracidiphilus sp.]